MYYMHIYIQPAESIQYTHIYAYMYTQIYTYICVYILLTMIIKQKSGYGRDWMDGEKGMGK